MIEDALDTSTLVKAGIDRCRGRGLISTFSDDTQNVCLVLEVREFRPGVEIVNAASMRESTRRLYLAGAARVITPTAVGGELPTKSALSPHIYQLLSDIVAGTADDNNISQVIESAASGLAGRTPRVLPSLGCSAGVMLAKTMTVSGWPRMGTSGSRRVRCWW